MNELIATANHIIIFIKNTPSFMRKHRRVRAAHFSKLILYNGMRTPAALNKALIQLQSSHTITYARPYDSEGNTSGERIFASKLVGTPDQKIKIANKKEIDTFVRSHFNTNSMIIGIKSTPEHPLFVNGVAYIGINVLWKCKFCGQAIRVEYAVED